MLSQDTGTLRLLGPCADPVGRGDGRALGVVGESSGGWCGRNPVTSETVTLVVGTQHSEGYGEVTVTYQETC